jgi:hypothetical protein
MSLNIEKNVQKKTENEKLSYPEYENEDLLDLKDQRDKIGNKSIFSEIWKQLGFKTDVFRITLPSILLQPVSLLEKFSTLPTPVSVLKGINNEKEELKTLKIVSWLLYNWRNTARKTFYLVKRIFLFNIQHIILSLEKFPNVFGSKIFINI